MSTLSIRILTYLIEYLGEFEFIFETILDNESGDQISSFDEKKRHRKSHAWAPLISLSFCFYLRHFILISQAKLSNLLQCEYE
jgi:hypothetical protein